MFIVTDPTTVRILAAVTISFLAVAGVLLVRGSSDRFEKVGFTLMFTLSITSIFAKVFC